VINVETSCRIKRLNIIPEREINMEFDGRIFSGDELKNMVGWIASFNSPYRLVCLKRNKNENFT
jgi:hypothetical protein